MQKKDEIKAAALSRMQNLCSKSEKCSSDIRQKLKFYKLDDSDMDEIIQSLTSDKFIDDQRFSLFFSRDKFKFNQWGKRKIRQSLFQKGIPEATIKECLNQINEKEYKDLLLKLIAQKNKTIKDTDSFSRKGKLFRFAAQKGFETDLIYQAIEEVFHSRES